MTDTTKNKKEGHSLQPLHDRVLVKREEEETRSSGGIIIPDTAKEKPMRGIVLAVGEGTRQHSSKGEECSLLPLTVKVGDQVLFGKWSGTEVKINGEDLIIMKESDIFAIIN